MSFQKSRRVQTWGLDLNLRQLVLFWLQIFQQKFLQLLVRLSGADDFLGFLEANAVDLGHRNQEVLQSEGRRFWTVLLIHQCIPKHGNWQGLRLYWSPGKGKKVVLFRGTSFQECCGRMGMTTSLLSLKPPLLHNKNVSNFELTVRFCFTAGITREQQVRSSA